MNELDSGQFSDVLVAFHEKGKECGFRPAAVKNNDDELRSVSYEYRICSSAFINLQYLSRFVLACYHS